MTEPLHIIGGGMAGSEAAWAAANLGVPVVIHEMRPKVATFAHRTGDFAEMVCSNSFRSDDHERNAVGLIHWEMRAAGSLVMEMAQKHRLPAGGALAVDRDPFARAVTEKLKAHPLISSSYEEVTELPSTGHWIIATGPLTSPALAESIRKATGAEALAFFDAIAPIVYAEGKAQQRMLTLDQAIGDQWLVAAGIAAGDRVIVEGLQRVRPGMAVKAAAMDDAGKGGTGPQNPARPAAGSN